MNTKYKLENLQKEIKNLEGIRIAGFTPGAVLTYQKALISVCEMHQPRQVGLGESLKSYDLGIRIQKAKDSLELNEEEMEFLKKIVSESKNFVSVVIGRLHDYLKNIDPIKVDDKK